MQNLTLRGRSKYGNRKVGGIDSRKEANRYEELKMLLLAGRIRDLKTQVSFELVPSQRYNGEAIRAVRYIADFVYYDNRKDCLVCEDVKGFKTKDYIIKRKLFIQKYGQEYFFIET